MWAQGHKHLTCQSGLEILPLYNLYMQKKWTQTLIENKTYENVLKKVLTIYRESIQLSRELMEVELS